MSGTTTENAMPSWETVLVEIVDGVAWVTLNRPGKRNAMNPQMNRDMVEVLDWLETDDRCRVLVLGGAGGNFSSGMDIKEYFRETDGKPPVVRDRAYRMAAEWQWRRLRAYAKPTIAMVNGWCFGGGFTPLIACDLALAAEDATFGLSEINWGIIPAGNVSKALASVVGGREALYFVMTGQTFDGVRAARMGLVNEAVPPAQLRDRALALARILMEKNPVVLRQAKTSFKNMGALDWELADEYLRAKQDQSRALDTDGGRGTAMEQFLDEKSFRPGLENYRRPE
ncbi:p-hydroxycinnamoyl CoA hydratase/lyase [Azospirillum doebereinerae]